MCSTLLVDTACTPVTKRTLRRKSPSVFRAALSFHSGMTALSMAKFFSAWFPLYQKLWKEAPCRVLVPEQGFLPLEGNISEPRRASLRKLQTSLTSALAILQGQRCDCSNIGGARAVSCRMSSTHQPGCRQAPDRALSSDAICSSVMGPQVLFAIHSRSALRMAV
jgi:hypothetical protein